jgi:putative molybdopterin biosynthesis protein
VAVTERDSLHAARRAAVQDQFLDVADADVARDRFHAHLDLRPLEPETVVLADLPGRILAADVVAAVDAPPFDRSVVDGFAVRASDTGGASDTAPRRLRLNPEVLACGTPPTAPVAPGTATVIATGGMIPRGADAVVMVEHTDVADGPEGPEILVMRPAALGQFVGFAGSDVARGETVLRAGARIGSREIGILAAIGRDRAAVVRRPRVAILSTGDELTAPGDPLRPAAVYDSNGAILAAAVREAGGEPVPLGIVRDDEAALAARLEAALDADMVLLSGGTSKGAGDLSYRVVSRLGPPGIVVHGVALKPGKPLCLAVARGTPVVVLPGFPTSAIFTFHEFVAPVIRTLAGLPAAERTRVEARLPVRLASERGRTEYAMVSLVRTDDGLAAFPLGKGSGAVTAFSQADGFVAVPPLVESVEAGARVSVQLIDAGATPPDLVVVGSHCVGLDRVVSALVGGGFTVKALNVGSLGGLAAARRGECDVAPVHLLDPATGVYNRPLLTPGLDLVAGWRRMQGIVFRPGDARFEGRAAADAVAAALADAACVMVNRNAGSGTRVLIDGLLAGARPPGWGAQTKSHNAVAVAVAQGRADWGVAIATVARTYGLGFLSLTEEHYDFVVPTGRRDRPAVVRFVAALADPGVRAALADLGFGTEG